MREPQWKTVKRCIPVSHIERKPIPSSRLQAARTNRKREVGEIPSWSIERGERTKVVLAYLEGLAGSTRWKRELKSYKRRDPDGLSEVGLPHIVRKLVKVSGAKGQQRIVPGGRSIHRGDHRL